MIGDPDLDAPATRDRDADLVVAGLHLRLGSLALARAELEAIAGRNGLDDEAIRDLAETRWRTGDLVGAGEAAAAYLETHPDDVVCLVIAAEAQSQLGRPGEARRLAGRALDRVAGPLDPIFAGMARSPIWPVDPGLPAEPAGTLFDDLHPGPASTRAPRFGAPPDQPPVDPAIPIELHVDGPGLWPDAPVADVGGGEAPTAGTLLDRARATLDAGAVAEAAAAFILALRAEPAVAPAILSLLAGRTEPILVLVRGDAHRIVGHEAEALHDHAVASATVGAPDPVLASAPPGEIEPTLAFAEGDGDGPEPDDRAVADDGHDDRDSGDHDGGGDPASTFAGGPYTTDDDRPPDQEET